MRKGNRGKLSRTRRFVESRTDTCANQQALVGLTAKVVSNAPPVFRNRIGKIESIKGKTVELSFSDGRYENELTIPLEGLHIYTMAKKEDGTISPGIRFK